MRKRHLTIDEHKRTALKLMEVRAAAMDLLMQVQPRVTKARLRKLNRIVEAIDSARCEFDGQFAKEHPAQFDTRVYYPGAGKPRQLVVVRGADVDEGKA